MSFGMLIADKGKHVTKLRKKSIRNYLSKECEGNAKGFWKTVKPLFDNKSRGSVDNVLLCDNGLTSYKSNEV